MLGSVGAGIQVDVEGREIQLGVSAVSGVESLMLRTKLVMLVFMFTLAVAVVTGGVGVATYNGSAF